MTISVTAEAARRFVRAALHLDEPLPDVGAALDRLGYVQMDPINVCGRMHDLILRPRVAGYREGDLLGHLYAPGERLAFEHYLPGCLVALPVDAYPILRPRMEARSRATGNWSGRLTAAQKRMAERLLGEIGDRGPLSSSDVEPGGRATTGWGSRGTLAKTTLEKLFFHGALVLARRDGFRRVYDLPERVLPRRVLDAPEVSAAEHAAWLVRVRLRQRRLARLSRNDLARVGDEVIAVKVDDLAPLYVLGEDAERLRAAAEPERGDDGTSPPVLLAPLDPLVYDRVVTRRLWDFEYTWEVYTPPAKRKRGYYALPVLAGARLVGHVDPKADRERKRLTVVSRKAPRAVPLRAAVAELARFLGLGR